MTCCIHSEACICSTRHKFQWSYFNIATKKVKKKKEKCNAKKFTFSNHFEASPWHKSVIALDARQVMLSQPSLPTTQCCTGRIAREAKKLHAVLYSLTWLPFRGGPTAITCSTMAASQPNCPLVQDLEQQSNSPRYALRILIYRASPIIPTLVLLWPPISVGTTTSIIWAERLLATFTCAEPLLSATRCMEWPFVASLLHLFVHAWSTVVQCGVVHHLPC